MYYYYTKYEDSDLRELHEGKPSSTFFEEGKSNLYCDGRESTTALAHKKVSVCFPLHLVGCLSPMRKNVFPLMATGGMRIRFTLARANKALVAMSDRMFDIKTKKIVILQ